MEMPQNALQISYCSERQYLFVLYTVKEYALILYQKLTNRHERRQKCAPLTEVWFFISAKTALFCRN